MKIYNVMVKASETSPTPYFPFPKAFSSLEAAENWVYSMAHGLGIYLEVKVEDPMLVYVFGNKELTIHFFIYEQEI